MPLFQRQKILLGLLADAPRVPTIRELSGWAFLLKQESLIPSDLPFYDFIPHSSGPMSYTLSHEVETLGRKGFFKKEALSLAPRSSASLRNSVLSLPKSAKDAIHSVLEKYAHLPHERFMVLLQEKWPWFFAEDELEGRSRSSSKAVPAAYTAGYEGQSIETFLRRLLKAGIERILDVRKNPVSRKYGFSKNTLGRLSANFAIEYVHMPQLGIPPAQRKNLASFGDYQELMRHYERAILPSVPEALQEAGSLAADRPSALMCYEADSRCCHRGRLAKALSERRDLKIVHL